MRLQLWEAGGVRVLDDCYNANADSTIAALETLCDLPLQGRRVAVLGDMNELGAHSEAAHAEVGRRAAELGIGQLFAVGKMAPVMAKAARDAGLNRVIEFADVEAAMKAVKQFFENRRRGFVEGVAGVAPGAHRRNVEVGEKREIMLYYLSQQLLEWTKGTPWADHLSALRLFRYITVRSAGAAITALALSWWLGPKIIRWLKQLKFGQEYADKAELAGGLASRVLSKKGTPTMGGVLIVTVLVFSTVLWTELDNKLVLLTLLSVLVLAGLGFYDDYAKIIQQSGGGTPPRVKLLAQIAVSAFIGVYLWLTPSTSKLVSEIMVPFYKYPVATDAAWLGIVDRRAGHRRHVQRGEPHRRSRRPGDRLFADRGVCVSGVHLCGGQRQGGGLSANSLWSAARGN